MSRSIINRIGMPNLAGFHNSLNFLLDFRTVDLTSALVLGNTYSIIKTNEIRACTLCGT
jgi:hypothetical protein